MRASCHGVVATCRLSSGQQGRSRDMGVSGHYPFRIPQQDLIMTLYKQ